MTTRSTRVRSLAFFATAAVFLLLPAAVAAHAELDVATPADGATVEGQPAEVAGTYTQEVNPDGSSLVLRDAANAVVARGGVDPDDDHRMVITDLPDLAPGEYLVQSVTISAEDDELDRATWSFTVEAAPTPEPTPTPAPTVAPSATPTASPTPEPTPRISPTPSGPPQDPTGSTADVVLPIIAGLAIVLVAAGLLLSRRNRPSGHA